MSCNVIKLLSCYWLVNLRLFDLGATMSIEHSELAHNKVVKNPILRALLFMVGWLSVALGVIGIFLPVLPTTPFLLLAAACFIRTSPKFYDWLVQHPKLAKYLIYYLEGKGIPLKGKVYTLITLWTTIIISAFILLDSQIVRVILPTVALLVSIYIMRQPTLEIHTEATEKH